MQKVYVNSVTRTDFGRQVTRRSHYLFDDL